MRSMVEGLTESVGPSTAFQAVPLPMRLRLTGRTRRGAPYLTGKPRFFISARTSGSRPRNWR